MAATPLRELIARVVLRVDESTLKRLDASINASKAKLQQVQAAGKEGIKVNVNATETEKALIGIRVALQEMGKNVSPELSAKLREQLEAGREKADELRAAIDKLHFVGATEEAKKLESELNDIEREAKKTAGALDAFDEGLKKANAEAKKLPGILGKIQENWNKLGPGLQAIGVGFSAAAIGMWVEGTLQAADAVGKLASRLGTSTDEVQVWMTFASQAGASTEDLSAGFKGLANQLQAVANGDKAAKAAFDELGISTDGWEKKLPPLGDTLALVGGALAELDNEGKRVALTQKLLSEGGLKLAPGFKGGTAAVQEQINKLKELAVVYDSDFIAQAEAANDEMAMFKAQFSGLGSELILTFMPALRGTVQTLTPLIRGIRDAFKNSEILRAVLAATGIAGLSSFGGISGIITRFGPMLARIATLVAPLIKGFLKFAAIALILDDFFVMLNGGKSVLGELLGRFELGRAVLETFQNTFKALKGTVLLAWGALSGDEAAVSKGQQLLNDYVQWMDGILDNVGFMFDDVFLRLIPELATEGWNALDEATQGALSGIMQFIAQWVGEIGGVFGNLWKMIVSGVQSAVGQVTNWLGKIPGVGSLLESGSSAQAGLDAGSPQAPTLPGNASNSNVSVTNNYTLETNIGGGASREVVAAVQKTERTYTAAIKDNRKTLRHAVGATR